jgi:hypothetical protein
MSSSSRALTLLRAFVLLSALILACGAVILGVLLSRALRPAEAHGLGFEQLRNAETFRPTLGVTSRRGQVEDHPRVEE